MINFLNGWKTYAFIISLLLNALLYHQVTNLDGKLQLCKANDAKKQIAIDFANKQTEEKERKLRLTEQEIAKASAASQKRKDYILNKEIKNGCEGANQFLLDFALGFDWKNNIP